MFLEVGGGGGGGNIDPQVTTINGIVIISYSHAKNEYLI